MAKVASSACILRSEVGGWWWLQIGEEVSRMMVGIGVEAMAKVREAQEEVFRIARMYGAKV